MGWWLLTEKARKLQQTGNWTGLLLLWKLLTNKSRNLSFVVSSNNFGNSRNFRIKYHMKSKCSVIKLLMKPHNYLVDNIYYRWHRGNPWEWGGQTAQRCLSEQQFSLWTTSTRGRRQNVPSWRPPWTSQVILNYCSRCKNSFLIFPLIFVCMYTYLFNWYSYCYNINLFLYIALTIDDWFGCKYVLGQQNQK